MAPRGRQSSGSRFIEFTIKAKDELAPVANKASSAVGQLWKQTKNLTKSLLEASQASLTFADGLLSVANRVGRFVGEAKSAISVLEEMGFTAEFVLDALDFGGNLGLTDSLRELGTVGNAFLSGLIPGAERVTQIFSSIPPNISQAIGQAVNRIDGFLLNVSNRVQKAVTKSQQSLDLLASPLLFVSGVKEAGIVFDALKSSVGGVTSTIFNLTQEIGFFSIGLQGLASLVNNGPFAALIGQNIKLREQLLATRASLAATNKIIQDGIAIANPTQAIQALEAPVDAAIQRLRQKSLDLVGVTSDQLVPLFQLVAQNAGNIQASMSDITDLSIGFAATMGTANIPLNQAGEEVRSLLTGTADMNTQLLRYLGLNNEILRTWISQGTVVENLNKRFQTFVEGNRLAAQQFGGVTSNIQEIFEEISRVAGEPLLDIILKELQQFFATLKTNRKSLEDFAGELVKLAVDGTKAIIDLGKALATALAPLTRGGIEFLFKSFSRGATTAAAAIKDVLEVMRPFIEILGRFIDAANPVGNFVFDLFVRLKTLQFGIGALSSGFGVASNAIAGLGEAMFLLNARTNPLLGLFTGLSKGAGVGTTSLLSFAAGLNKLPPVITNVIAGKLGALGPLAFNLGPQFAKAGLGVAALTKQFPILGKLLGGTDKGLTRVLGKVSVLAQKNGFPELAKAMQEVSKSGSIMNAVNDKAIVGINSLGKTVRNTVIRYAAYAAAFVAAGFAINEFILKNEELIATLGSLFNFIVGLPGQIVKFFSNPIIAATTAVAGLTIALSLLNAKMIETIATMATGGLLGAVTKLRIAFLALAKSSILTSAFPLLKTNAIAASKALGGIAAAAKAGTLSFTALTTSVVAFGKAALAALAPIAAKLALIGAGIALIAVIRRTRDLADANEAIRITTEDANQVQEQAIRIAEKLAKARESQKNSDEAGVALTAEQIKQNKIARKQASLEVESIDDRIKSLKELNKTASKEFRASNDQLIIGLEKTRESLVAQSGAIRIANKELENLGTTAEQLERKIDSAFRAFDDPRDLQALEQSAEQILDFTQQQLELGEISLDAAIDRFESVSQKQQLSFGQQRKAIQAIQQALKTESDLRVGAIDANIKLIESQSGYQQSVETSEVEITNLRKKQIQERLSNVFDQMGQETDANSVRSRQLINEEKQLQAELIKIENEAIEQRIKFRKNAADRVIVQTQVDTEFSGANEIEAINERFRQSEEKALADLTGIADRRQQLNQNDIKGLEELQDLENKINLRRVDEARKFIDERVNLLGREREEAVSELALQQAETEALVEQQRLVTRGKDSEFDAEKLKARRERIENELDLERGFLAALEALPEPQSASLIRDREKQIRDQKLKTFQLTQQLAEAEQQAQKEVTESLSRELRKRSEQIRNLVTARENELRSAETIATAVSEAIQRQEELLGLRVSLQGAISGFVDSQFNILQKAARTDKERAKFAQQAAIAQQKLLEDNIKIERERLRLSQETRRSELEIEIIRSRVAELQAQANAAERQAELEVALADPDASARQIEALQLAFEASQQQVGAQQQATGLLTDRRAGLGDIERIEDRTQRFRFVTQRDQAALRVAETEPNERRRQSRLRRLASSASFGVSEGLSASRANARQVQSFSSRRRRNIEGPGSTSGGVQIVAATNAVKMRIEDLRKEAIETRNVIRDKLGEVREAVVDTMKNTDVGDFAGSAPAMFSEVGI